MTKYCRNSIEVTATKSEWNEIADAFETNTVNWSETEGEIICDEDEQSICFVTKLKPEPLYDGSMNSLSLMFPSALFHYTSTLYMEYLEDPEELQDILDLNEFGTVSTWICNGNEVEETRYKKGASLKKTIRLWYDEYYKTEAKESYLGSFQECEKVECINSIYVNRNISINTNDRLLNSEDVKYKKISYGKRHVVAIKRDGTIIATGSNVNGQCDLSNISEPVSDISCGRYHTGILLKNGKVLIRGNVEDTINSPDLDYGIKDNMRFPCYLTLQIRGNIDEIAEINKRIEKLHKGEELICKKRKYYHSATLEIFNIMGEKIGEPCFPIETKRLVMKYLDYIKIYVASVEPLSQRCKNAKYGKVVIKLDAVTKTPLDVEYSQIPVDEWPLVEKILSIYDAVVGMDSNNNLYVDGFCPYSKAELFEILTKNRR